MDVKSATDVGRVRENNEDAFWVASNCLVVCDGMGGHQAGEVAAAMAIQTVSEFPFRGQDPERRTAHWQAQEKIARFCGNASYSGMGAPSRWSDLRTRPDGISADLRACGDSAVKLTLKGSWSRSVTTLLLAPSLFGHIPLEARVHPKKHVRPGFRFPMSKLS